MPRARYQQISLDSTPYYHCISRCVRRAFLCGEDYVSGKSFEHRRGWIEARLLLLTEVFVIDVLVFPLIGCLEKTSGCLEKTSGCLEKTSGCLEKTSK